jgi:hypothetical protein
MGAGEMEKESTDFKSNFMDFVCQRTEVSLTNSEKLDTYKNNFRTIDEIEQQIIEKPNAKEELRKMLSKIYNAHMDSAAIHVENAYLQGMQDGVLLLELLKG